MLFHACSGLDPENQRIEAARAAQALADEGGVLLYLHGNVEDALDKVTEALEIDPLCLDALRIAADCLDRLNRPDEAFALLDRPIGSAGARTLLMEEAARLCLGRRQPSLALTYLDQAIVCTPWSADLYLYEGKVEASYGREKAARTSFMRAIELGGDEREILPLLADVALRTGEAEQAESILETELDPESFTPEEKVLYGVVKCELHEVAEGVALFRDAVRCGFESPEALYNMGVALEEMDRTEDAEHAYQEAIKGFPTYGPARFQLGCLWFEQGKREEGLAQIDRAIHLEQSSVVKKALKDTRASLTAEQDEGRAGQDG